MKIGKATRAAAVALAVLALLPILASCSHEHVFTEWQTDEKTHSRSCTAGRCDVTEAGEHTFDAGTVTKEAEVGAPGVMTYTCTVCGYSYTAEIPEKQGIVLNEFEEFDTHTPLQKKYLADSVDSVNKYAEGVLEQSTQGTPVFKWALSGVPEDTELLKYTLYLSPNEDFEGAKTYSSRYFEYDRSRGFDFLIKTRYYWKVTANLRAADGSEFTLESKVSSFMTLDGPRTLDVDGVANFRDLGGKECEGGVIRQNLIFRCGRLNPNYSKTPSITSSGKKKLVELGIRAEIDFRGSVNDAGLYQNGFKTDGSEPMTSWGGDQIRYYLCPAVYHDTILSDAEGKKMVKDTFAILADPDNYPLIFHCSIGTDRTGVIAFLIECVCGVDYEVMARDYLFSNFANIGSKRTYERFTTVMAPVRAASGSTYREKATNYLTKIGVPLEQIESVREILVEKN